LVETNRHIEDFNELLLEAIDDALSSLGESSKIAIYFFLEEKFNIQKHEIPYKLEDFACALERMLNVGAKWLEILFIKKLNATLGTTDHAGLYCIVRELTFQGYVELIRRNFEDKGV